MEHHEDLSPLLSMLLAMTMAPLVAIVYLVIAVAIAIGPRFPFRRCLRELMDISRRYSPFWITVGPTLASCKSLRQTRGSLRRISFIDDSYMH